MMKNKMLLAFSLLAVLGGNANAQDFKVSPKVMKAQLPAQTQENEYILKTCGGDNLTSLGISNSKCHVRVATKITADMAKDMAGNKLSSIMYALGYGTRTSNNSSGFSNIKVFVSEDLDGQDLISQSVSGEDKYGWHEIKLDEQYTITEKEFYIGYEGDLAASYYGVGIDTSAGDYSLCSLYIDGEKYNWDASFGSILIYGAAVGDKTPDTYDLQIFGQAATAAVKNGQQVDVNFYIRNKSYEKINNINLTYGYEGDLKTETITDQVEAGGGVLPVNFKLDGTTSSSGIESKKIIIKVEKGNDSRMDSTPENNEVSMYTNIYNDGATLPGKRVVLFEHFSTEMCPNCPLSYPTIESALEGHEGDVVRVTHHSGYYTDSYSTEYGELITPFFYNSTGTYAPAGMMSRTYYEGIGGNGSTVSPVFGINKSNMTKALQYQLESPVFATLNLETSYDESNKTISIKVTGENILKLNNPSLNIFITEDGIKSMNQAGATGSVWTHDHVVREAITGVEGYPVETVDGKFEYETTYVIPETYPTLDGSVTKCNSDNINVVAFFANMNPYNPFDCNVYYAATNTRVTSGIQNASDNSDIKVYVVSDNLVIEGQYQSAEVYTVEGTLVKVIEGNTNMTSMQDLNNGIYVVRVNDGTKYGVTKVSLNK